MKTQPWASTGCVSVVGWCSKPMSRSIASSQATAPAQQQRLRNNKAPTSHPPHTHSHLGNQLGRWPARGERASRAFPWSPEESSTSPKAPIQLFTPPLLRPCMCLHEGSPLCPPEVLNLLPTPLQGPASPSGRVPAPASPGLGDPAS